MFRNRNILLNSFWSNKRDKTVKNRNQKGLEKMFMKDFVKHNLLIHKFKTEKNL